jgi:hypothetical protein
MVYTELLQRVLEVIPARLAVPVVAECDSERSKTIHLRNHMELEDTVLPTADRDDTIVIVACLPTSILKDLSELLFPVNPVDMNLLLRRLTGLADPKLVEGDALRRLREAATLAIGQVRVRRSTIFTHERLSRNSRK